GEKESASQDRKRDGKRNERQWIVQKGFSRGTINKKLTTAKANPLSNKKMKAVAIPTLTAAK
ncbi:32000_t:CDS:2, partial [Racocetra persica]